MIDSANEFAIVATDAVGTITLFNHGAEKMLGYRAERMVGRRTPRCLFQRSALQSRATVLSAQLRQPVHGLHALVAVARLGQSDQQQWELVRRDRRCLPVRLVVSAIHDADRRIIGFLGIAIDISGQRELESTLVRAKELAEAASRAKSDFVANMSHEIRTPLNAVLGIADLLDSPALPPEQRKYVVMIRESGRSLLTILNEILDFEKVEAGRMELSPQPFQLDDVLVPLANVMAVSAGGKPLDLALGIAADVPVTLVGDGQRLRQVLFNLVGNALKFTDQGEVAVWIEPVPGMAASDGVSLRFCVRDSGIGIGPDQREKLFSPFVQGDSSISRRYGGSGLGLALSRRLVELMGGTLALDSLPGQGSTFSFTLPFQRGAAPADDVEAWSPLLLVDQPRTSRHYLAKSLAWRAIEADCVDSVEAALVRMRRAVVPFRVVLMDFQCVPPDGAVACGALRAHGAAIVLMVDDAASALVLEERIGVMADAILVKPILPQTLRDALRRLRPQVTSADGSDVGLPPPVSDRVLAGLHILLVEDMLLNQLVARGLLERAGARVAQAVNGQQALDSLRRENDFDVVLMDVQMPEMDGYSATRAIRQQLGLTLPVLAMTAGVTQQEQQQCFGAGMDDVIAKPIESERLVAAILRHVARRAEGATGNLDKLMQLGAGDASYQQQLLALITAAAERAPAELAAAQAAWIDGDIQVCAGKLHGLRSSLAMIDGGQFATHSLALENELPAAPLADGVARFQALSVVLEQALRVVRRWLAGQQRGGPLP